MLTGRTWISGRRGRTRGQCTTSVVRLPGSALMTICIKSLNSTCICLCTAWYASFSFWARPEDLPLSEQQYRSGQPFLSCPGHRGQVRGTPGPPESFRLRRREQRRDVREAPQLDTRAAPSGRLMTRRSRREDGRQLTERNSMITRIWPGFRQPATPERHWHVPACDVWTSMPEFVWFECRVVMKTTHTSPTKHSDIASTYQIKFRNH